MRLGVSGSRLTVEGAPTFLLGVSYYGALGAPDDFIMWDLSELRELGFNWVRVWATWGAFGDNVSAVTARGEAQEPYLTRLKRLCATTAEMGFVLDVTLSRGNGLVGANLDTDQEAHLRAVSTLTQALKPYRHVYFDLANERNVTDRRHVPIAQLSQLRERCRLLDPGRLVVASHCGDVATEDAAAYLSTVRADVLAPHRPRHPQSPAETEARTVAYGRMLRDLGRPAPILYQEPFRRGFGDWQPGVADFVTDLRGALSGGAAGWCFHNGHDSRRPDGRPRRSFDMRPGTMAALERLDLSAEGELEASPGEGRLFDQLEPEELEVMERAGAVLQRG
ncbi:MAG: glycoside hydrolase family 5 protein [Anaerolineae bacterium]